MANTLITADQMARELAESFNKVCDEENLTIEQRMRLLHMIGGWIGGFPPQAMKESLRDGED